MEEVKPFWASRTIWVGLVGVLFPLLGAAGRLPAGLSEEQVVSELMLGKRRGLPAVRGL